MPAPTQVTAIANSHNARISHIRKFCATPPERGVVLRLVTIEDPPQCLGEWVRKQAEDSATVPVDVDQALEDHARAQRAAVKATLAWLDDDGGMVVSKRLNCQHVPPPPQGMQDDAQIEAAALDGSERSILVQQQTVLDKHARLYISAHQTQISQLTSLVRDIGHMLAESHKTAHQAHLELDKQRLAYRRELERMVDDHVPAGVEGDDRMQFIQQIAGGLSQAMPFILQGIVSKFGGQPANTNAAPVAPAPPAQAAPTRRPPARVPEGAPAPAQLPEGAPVGQEPAAGDGSGA